MNHSCYDCKFFDRTKFKKMGDLYCTKGQMIIRRKIGQGRPDDCPNKGEKPVFKREGEK